MVTEQEILDYAVKYNAKISFKDLFEDYAKLHFKVEFKIIVCLFFINKLRFSRIFLVDLALFIVKDECHPPVVY